MYKATLPFQRKLLPLMCGQDGTNREKISSTLRDSSRTSKSHHDIYIYILFIYLFILKHNQLVSTVKTYPICLFPRSQLVTNTTTLQHTSHYTELQWRADTCHISLHGITTFGSKSTEEGRHVQPADGFVRYSTDGCRQTKRIFFFSETNKISPGCRRIEQPAR
ncbi:hypothetical protein, unlikely [Trypanosoma brucei gambiense DAL972]|uniref:Uncharacterized protein n=1 Tax=Trypanosoma brucei gambiense (strain MHOM/CI/86/DAL972) TaxID=679716 RepID=D0A2D4_TRYB9|nr:hypothetical protein, unlikely [Trypanosoma brucei gambiense DAL972]CBH15428.1 hypothetical protein, unlikely [Trypanosoma brucei gambiense DAL972]|eukprot:XP_011777692.1 hypothetical protein, unlikely [Trypanosoma brucei gambiense DAL972]